MNDDRRFLTQRKRDLERGFSLIELLIVMAIFTVALAISSKMFVSILGQAKEQSKIAESQLEGLTGLEMLRSDIENAGFGLPWDFPITTSVSYSEANVPGNNQIANAFNVAPGIPKAMDGNQGGPNVPNASYLVIRATNVALSTASQTWTGLLYNGVITGLNGLGSDQPSNGQGVIVLNTEDHHFRQLVAIPGQFYATYANPGFSAAFSPPQPPENNQPSQVYMVYGVDNAAVLRMPFNRADYSVVLPGPASCANGTGVLTKSIVNHANGFLNSVPILDCVADFQVLYGLDTDGDGAINLPYVTDITALSAKDVRDELKEVRVYILFHEGRRDPSFQFGGFTGAGTSMRLGDAGLGYFRDSPLGGITNFQNYRWKVVTLAVTPKNLK